MHRVSRTLSRGALAALPLLAFDALLAGPAQAMTLGLNVSFSGPSAIPDSSLTGSLQAWEEFVGGTLGPLPFGSPLDIGTVDANHAYTGEIDFGAFPGQPIRLYYSFTGLLHAPSLVVPGTACAYTLVPVFSSSCSAGPYLIDLGEFTGSDINLAAAIYADIGGNTLRVADNTVSTVPVPGALPLLLSALGILAGWCRRVVFRASG